MTIPELEKLMSNRSKHGIKRIALAISDVQDLIDVAKQARVMCAGVIREDWGIFSQQDMLKALEKLKWEKPKVDKYAPGEWEEE